MSTQPLPTATPSTQPLQARMNNPASMVPGAMQAIQALLGAIAQAGVATTTLQLVHLRASQINGCGACVDGGIRYAKQAGETDTRLFAVSVWRDTPYFTAAERAALALAEAATRLSDRADAVSDEIWAQAAQYFDERALSALILSIATTNLFNRLNVTTRQVAGAAW